MRKFAVLFVFILLPIWTTAFGADELILTDPSPICTPDTYKIKIRSYVITPPPDGKISVYFDMCDMNDNRFDQGVVVIEGSDFTDVMGFNIRAEDVGTAIGQGLKQLVWNKLKTMYSIDFQ